MYGISIAAKSHFNSLNLAVWNDFLGTTSLFLSSNNQLTHEYESKAAGSIQFIRRSEV